MELLGHVHKAKDFEDKHVQIYRKFLKAMKGARTVSFSRNWKELEERYEIENEEEENSEDSDDTTEEIFIDINWFLCMGREFDRFVLCLHIAYLTNELEKIYYLLQQPIDKQLLWNIFGYFGVAKI